MRTSAVLLIAAVLLSGAILPSPAVAAAEPGPLVVEVRPGFDARWTLQRWAPLRITFDLPADVATLEVQNPDAGPSFRIAVPPSPGRFTREIDVYAQVASDRWLARATLRDGRVIEQPFELGVQFVGHTLRVGQAGDVSAMELAAAVEVRQADRLSPDQRAAYLATGRPLQLGPGGATVSLAETFGPPADTPLLNEAFYQTVWTGDQGRWPEQARVTPLALLAGAALLVLAIALAAGRRTRLAAVLAIGVLLASAGASFAWLAAYPGAAWVELELITRTGDAVEAADAPPAVRRQRWIGLAARRGGTFPLPPADPTPQLLVADLSSRPALRLPANYAAPPEAAGRIALRRGQFWALLSTDYQAAGNRVRLVDGRIVWTGPAAPPTLSPAWLVEDAKAYPVADDGRVRFDEPLDWANVYADAGDRPNKRLLKYWSTQTPRGGRRWLVGWQQAGRPSPGDEPPADETPADGLAADGSPEGSRRLQVIDLGPLSP